MGQEIFFIFCYQYLVPMGLVNYFLLIYQCLVPTEQNI